MASLVSFTSELEAIEQDKNEIETIKKIFSEAPCEYGLNNKTMEVKLTIPLNTLGVLNRILDTAKEDKEYVSFFYAGFLQAVTDFRRSKARFEAKAADFLKALGVTTGKRQSKINKFSLGWEYIKLVKGIGKTEPLEPDDALEVLRKRYELVSKEAALKQIQLFLAELKQERKTNGGTVDDLKKLLPGNPPWRYKE